MNKQLSRFFTEEPSRKSLRVILILAAVLRIGMAFFSPFPNIHRDSLEYYKQADILLSGGYLNYFPNGYPMIVAIAKVLSPAHSQGLLLWLNVIMSTLTVYFVYDIAKRLFNSQPVALLAALIMAIFPPQLNYTRWIMSEIPTIFFLLGAFFFYFRRQFWLCGLFFGVVTAIRTNVMPVFLLLAVVELIWQRKLNYRMLIAAFIPILLLGYYCYLKTGEFSIEGNDKINIMYAVTAFGNHIDFRINEHHPEIDTKQKAIDWYMDHMKKKPGEWFVQRMANLWEMWGFLASDADGFRNPVIRIILGGCNFFLIVFGIYGWWKNVKDYRICMLILPFLVLTGIHTLLVAIPRYGYPAHPFMIILAAWSLWQLLTYRNKKKITSSAGSPATTTS